MTETHEIAIVVVVVVLLIGLIVMLKMKNRGIRFMLRTLREEQRPAAAAPAKRAGMGGAYTSVDLLEEGSILAEDVHDTAGKMVLLDAGTVLTKKNIEKLKNWGVRSVFLK
ncbi:MAG TPA: hypothetical protein PKM88_11650 [bacterium]|nr:hypothetical protein [bacterium]